MTINDLLFITQLRASLKWTLSRYSEELLGDPILYPSPRIGIPHRPHFQYSVADALGLGSAEIRGATRFKDRPAALRPGELVIVASHVTEEFEKLEGRLGEAMYNVSIATSIDEGVRDTEVNSRSGRGLQTTHWLPYFQADQPFDERYDRPKSRGFEFSERPNRRASERPVTCLSERPP